MRRWRFGEFTSEHAVIHMAQLGNVGRSIIVEGTSTNQEQTAPSSDGVSVVVQQESSDLSFSYAAVEVELALLKAKLGQIPILIAVELNGCHDSPSESSQSIEVRRFINPPTILDCTNRYRDKTGLVTWYEDVYAPYWGQDIEDPPSTVNSFSMEAYSRFTLDVREVVERALRDNTAVSFMLRTAILAASDLYIAYNGTAAGRWPYFDFTYLYPIEFYAATPAGDIDITSVIDDDPGNEYYLGAVERDQEGTPVKGFFRNYTDAAKQIEIFDDHPEDLTPVQRVGTGTGELDYVVLADNAVSQLYTAVFYSSTQYEIKAVAYRDNAISLHPQINADASWRGTTGTDFTAPEGGLSIPAAAWQPGTLLDDEIEVGVRGNTTVSTWPADSNEQVEITFDDSGSPDTSEWRLVIGRRVKSTGAVTIDATTKLIPTRYVLPADWPIGTKAFIHNLAEFDAGQVKSIQEADIGTPAFTGTGTDDLTASGNHNGSITDTYRVEIDAAGTPGTFKWSRDGGSGWVATGITPTGSPQLLENGIYVTIPTGTTHDLGDYWDIAIKSFAVELEGLTSGSTTYGSGAIVGTTLPFRDVAAAVFARVSAASGASETPASRVYLDDTSGFTQGDTLLLEQATGDGESEFAIIATGGVQTGYLDLTAALTNDYIAGDFVTVSDSGATPFWMRCVAGPTTVEELKTLRLNARML